MSNTQTLIGSAQACTILGIHRATLGRWVTAGRLTPVTQLPGLNGAMLFDFEDVQRLADELAGSAA